MRYRPGHKAETRRKIVADASRRLRAQGIAGAAVSAVMQDAGLTHGGFYKHFTGKDQLLLESLGDAFRDISDTLVRAATRSRSEAPWKAIVKTYLRPEYCNPPGRGCPLPALAPELARVAETMKPQVLAELIRYRDRMVPFMPGRGAAGRERAFFVIFSTMAGAVQIARLLPDRARRKVLAAARDFLLSSF